MNKMIAARRDNGLTLMDVAIRSGVSPSTVSRIERGVCGASPRVAKRIAGVLGIDPADVIFNEPSRLKD